MSPWALAASQRAIVEQSVPCSGRLACILEYSCHRPTAASGSVAMLLASATTAERGSGSTGLLDLAARRPSTERSSPTACAASSLEALCHVCPPEFSIHCYLHTMRWGSIDSSEMAMYLEEVRLAGFRQLQLEPQCELLAWRQEPLLRVRHAGVLQRRDDHISACLLFGHWYA